MAGQDRDSRRGEGAGPPTILRRAEGSDTMEAWERFLTGGARAAMPRGNFVVSSWRRSQAHGIDPGGRAAPLVAQGDAFFSLHQRNRRLIEAAQDIFGRTAELLAGARSIMVLTDVNGVVLHVTGDHATRGEGETIHLMQGGHWHEDRIGTNGIGTAIATARPAHIHAAEHFCEGIKSWTCAACPIFEPDPTGAGLGTMMGVIDISGPPMTYQRSNLILAVTTARQIEGALAERSARERFQLMEACMDRLSGRDVGGLVALDRAGRLIHAAGRACLPVPVGQVLPGLDEQLKVEDWVARLPSSWRPEWFSPVAVGGETIGAMLVVPDKAAVRGPANRPALPGKAGQVSEADPDRASFDRIVGRSEAIHLAVERARMLVVKQENQTLATITLQNFFRLYKKLSGMTGTAMTEAVGRARQLVGKQVPVLIEGETGVGKELLARAIHGESARGTPCDTGSIRPFIVMNCGGFTRELIPGELFGHVRGAFTGATAEGRPGRFELAHGSTLCLDEIGEMPLDVQPFLPRALEEGVLYRLVDAQPRRVDVRLITMTNRNLLDDVNAGRFRRDLYYRISVTRLRIPPLRERGDDVLLLAEHFARVQALRHGVPRRRFTAAAEDALLAHDWPGNARELRNVVESLLLMGGPGDVAADELAPYFGAADPAPPQRPAVEGAAAAPPPITPPARSAGADDLATLRDGERDLIVRALSNAHGSFSAAARLLGISRATLYRKSDRYGLRP